MLTRQGWALASFAVGLAIGGRLLGVLELYVLAGVLGALVLGALVHTRMVRLQVDIAREIHPARVHAGSPSRVDLRVENRGGRRSPVLELHDAVSGTRGAHLTVGPLAPGGVVRAAYRLPTERRGVLTVGPLGVAISDPFGLSRLEMQASGPSELTVYPHVDVIAPVPQTSGSDPMAGAEHPNALGRNGEDFYALRHYVVGDDLRRVHWPATARHDDLMVRQDELPWQGRVTIVADVRRSACTPDTLEMVISAAASILLACTRRSDLVRLVTTDGADTAMGSGQQHAEAGLEHLAGIEACADLGFAQVAGSLARTTGAGALVAVVADTSEADLALLRQLRRRFASLYIVRFDPGAADHDLGSSPAQTVVVPGVAEFPSAWNQAVGPAWKRRAVRSSTTAASAAPVEPEEDRWSVQDRSRRRVQQ